ncbi:signal peptide protein [Burkholderia aenigmatica]|uniref:Signal peptide protein n=3 Tax=Burkholderia TaxID=32008 RepID=A0A6J5JAA1_9BURK|nr:signal peptide protein [Burkholderia aenigmatica]
MTRRMRPAQAVAQCVAAALCGACGIVTALPPAFAATPAVHTVTVQADPSSHPAVDPRSFMHGIGVADAGNGKRWVFFSSSGIVPRGAMRNGNWPHDVYVGEWLPGKPHLLHVHTFISRPEAQEPVSIAQNARGDIFVTFEDGWNAPQEVSQRYGVYRRDLKPIKPYPNDVESGGHSGHVATAADRFVVFYSADWIDGGGVDNLGTGNGVYVKTYDAAGRVLNHVEVAPHRREWWPVIAGSPHTALLVWQKFIDDSTDAKLEYALFDPVTAKLDMLGELNDAIQYYVYSAAYVPAIDRFIVTTTTANGRGVAMLIAPDGQRTATLECLPATVRESSIGVAGARAYVPIRDGRLLTLALSPAGIAASGAQPSPIPWGTTGIAGFPARGDAMHFVSLTPSGTREADFEPEHETPLAKSEVRCSSH